MDHIGDSFLRVIVSFTVLLIIVRIIGKKQLGQLNIFTYITGMAIGSIAGDVAVHSTIELQDAVIAIILWGGLTFLVEIISIKLKRVNTLLNSQPTIVIKRGQIVYDKLKKMRLNTNDLMMLLRTNNVFSITQVEYAILEPNGDLSILKKQEYEEVTKKDMNLSLEPVINVPTVVISDGKILAKPLKELGKDENWLINELYKNNIKSQKEIIYAEIIKDGTLYFQKYE